MSREVRYLNKAIAVYSAIYIMYRLADLLVPANIYLRDLVARIHLTRIVMVIGFTLIILDIFSHRFKYVMKNSIYLYLFLIFAGISSLVRYRYGLVGDIAIISLDFIQIYLFATLMGRLSQNARKKMFLVLHTYTSIIFIPVYCYMFYQFYIEQYYMVDGLWQGYIEGRLFGIFGSVAYSALLSTLLALATFLRFRQTSSWILKLVYIIEIVICVINIALADTRGVYLGIALIFVLAISYVLRKKYIHDRKNLKKYVLLGIVFSIFVVAILYGVKVGIRKCGDYLVYKTNYNKEEYVQWDKFFEEKERPKQATISSRRVYIWQNYLYIFTDDISHMIVGLSPGGMNKYIFDRYSDNYLVTFMEKEYPLKYARGQAYQTHNAYLGVLIKTGIPGFLLVMIFLIKSFLCVSGYFLSGKDNDTDKVVILMLIVILVLNLFEDMIFLNSSAISNIFWLLSGYLLTRIQEAQEI